MKDKNQKGSILYFAVLILGMLFSAGAAVTTMLIQRVQMVEEMSYSSAAFYAADAGIEKVLYRWADITDDDEIFDGWSDGGNPEFGDGLAPGQEYYLRKEIRENGEQQVLIVVSVGSFSPFEDAGVVKRGIQVSREYEEDE